MGSELMPEATLKKQQVAAMLQVSERQVDRYVAEKKLPVSRLGHKTVRFKIEDVERFLKRHRQ
jgi:excisionase family DNA binding protein